MSLLIFTGGVVVGAAFSPFWMMLWDKIKVVVKKDKPPTAPPPA